MSNTDPLAALKAMLNQQGAPAAAPAAAAVPPVVPPAPYSVAVPPPATPPASTPSTDLAKKRSTTMSLLMISAGVMICVYIYYKYYAPKVPAAMQNPHKTPQPVRRPQRTVHFNDQDEPRSSSPRVEEIFDDDDEEELRRRNEARKPVAAAPRPAAAAAKRPRAPEPAPGPAPEPEPSEPVPEDSDPNFQPLEAGDPPESSDADL